MSNTTEAPSPKGTNYERLFVVKRTGARMAHDAAPMNALKSPGNDGKKRWSGRDDSPLSDALDQLQNHLQGCLNDPDDLNTAQELISQLLEAAGGGQSEDSEASNDPERQRRDPDNFQGQDRGKRMAGDASTTAQRAPRQAPKLAAILATVGQNKGR